MNYQFATIVVSLAASLSLRKLSQMLDKTETDGMFTVELSATGTLPATHFISTGQVPSIYLTALSTPAKLKTAADEAYAKDGQVQPYTLTQITKALQDCTISDGTITSVDPVTKLSVTKSESPFELIARLGLKMIGGTIA